MRGAESSNRINVGAGVKITVYEDKDYRGCKQSFNNCNGTKTMQVQLKSGCVSNDVDSFRIDDC